MTALSCMVSTSSRGCVGGLVHRRAGQTRLHRYSLGGMTALSCMVSTSSRGCVGGLVHRRA
ncbi:hypothetical protein CKF46_37695, partial [Klebsiella pneumoniae]